MNDTTMAAIAPASVNGVAIGADAIHAESLLYPEDPDAIANARRALAIRELLRQRAVALGIVGAGAELDDATVDAAVDALIAREVSVPAPTEADCRRYYDGHPARFRRNDIVYASHILFAVTGGGALAPVRHQAEQTLRQLLAQPEDFEAAAREMSNCPSAGVGGSLGQLLRGDSVPEFEQALFDGQALGVLPGLVKTRFGFHIVRVERRVPGEAVPFDEARAEIARFLGERVRHKANQQYIAILASQASLVGVELGEANGPLVQ
ncbi:peptidylprolyl isomerase [Cupriavidus gilardii]|uniref:peptidylprolyl isomerase n=1 Tax=Cupriavidus gilardii TaxID=82541 RepID=UPI001ABEBC71|nr:peptidylprolyl isomerase [Cupriavidus gilardii]MBO4119181.1 peptidylprolyl isomerase [Cupriavidus gilardii]